MVYDAHAWVFARYLIRQLGGPVGAAVVNDEDLVVDREGIDGRACLSDDMAQIRDLVERGEGDRQRRGAQLCGSAAASCVTIMGMVIGRSRDQVLTLVAAAVAFAVFLTVVTTVPRLVPTATDVLGSAAEVGSNNGVAYVLYLLLLAVPAILVARWAGALPRTTWPTLGGALRSTPWRLVGIAAAAHIAVFAAIYAYKGRFVFSDGLYFQQLLHRMSQGEMPYRDAAYYYGPSMLYPAPWLMPMIGLPAAYGTWFVATYLIGLALLFVCLSWALGSRRVAAIWGIVLALSFFNAVTGVNLTLTRYLLPVGCFILSDRYVAEGGTARGVLAAAAVTFALLYSSEIAALAALAVALPALVPLLPLSRVVRGIARVVAAGRAATVTGPARRARRLARAGVLGGVSVLAAAVLLLAIDPRGSAFSGYALGTRAYLSGAFNVPFSAHLTTATLAGLTVVSVGLVTARLAAGGSVRTVSGLIALTVLALAAQRGAFGSSDPDHIAFYALPTILLAGHVAAPRWRGAPLMLAAVVVGLAAPMQMTNAAQFLPFVARVAPASGDRVVLDTPRATSVQASLQEIVERLGTDRPYLMYDLGYYSLPVYESFHLRYPAYATDIWATANADDLARALGEIRASGAYVVMWRTEYDGTATIPTADPRWNAVATVTGAHLPNSDLALLEARSRARLQAPFFDLVRSSYRVVYETAGLVGLAPK